MAVNKIIYGTTTLIDLTSDDAIAGDIANGKKAHNRTGNQVTGTLQFITYYTGSSNPSSSLGQNDDIYLKVGS